MGGLLAGFYAVLWVSGGALPDAREGGWVFPLAPPVPFYQAWELYRFGHVDWTQVLIHPLTLSAPSATPHTPLIRTLTHTWIGRRCCRSFRGSSACCWWSLFRRLWTWRRSRWS